ncbi:hypothetical protein NFI96_012376, partial [Prochilodus magdalenae]
MVTGAGPGLFGCTCVTCSSCVDGNCKCLTQECQPSCHFSLSLTACRPGSFKAFASSMKCSRCPAHSYSYDKASPSCYCEKGYFRAEKDPPAMACTRPPSAPRHVVYRINETALYLEWTPPSDTGGRKDLIYNVVCKRCSSDPQPCEACGEELHFVPDSRGLTEPYVTVLDFTVPSNYTFQIEAVNGVSHMESSPPMAAITVSTDQGGPSVVGQVQKEWASRSSIALSWDKPELHKPKILDYEIQYYEKDQKQTSYSSSRSQAPSIIISGLKPSTRYIFHIRSRTIAGYSNYSPKFEFATGSEASDLAADQGQVLVIVTAAVGGFTLLVILTLFYLITGRCQYYIKTRIRSDQTRTSEYQNGHVLLTGTKPNSSADTYEDPTQTMYEFSKELDPSRVRTERIIGTGQFGEVYIGCLHSPTKREVPVVIKSFKEGSVDRESWDFLREASIMERFDHPNIIKLEGMVTKCRPFLIMLEYMENGLLDVFLRKHDGHFTVMQLVGMLRGIASGMKHLSDLDCVHRNLTAHSILVNSNLVCKISDFGFAIFAEDNPEAQCTTTGGNISIRWTAPEAIMYRKFSQASDAWSYGIVMWEVMSYGDHPYWDMCSEDVILSIDEGYRLPAPLGCPVALHQLMLHCWQKQRALRPKFTDTLNVLDKLICQPSSLLALVENFQGLPDSPEDPPDYPISVSEWLKSIKMNQYKNNFATAGFTTLESVATMMAEDVRQIGVSLIGHQRRIINSIQTLRLNMLQVHDKGFH